MTKRLFVSGAAILALCVTTVVNSAEEKNEGAKKDEKGFKCMCPVSNKAAKKDQKVAYKGKEVYFCCAGCPDAFKKDTAKFAAKANHQLVGTKQAKQAKCPIKGTKCNPKHTVDVAGVKVAFCCPGCKGKAAEASGDDQIALLFGDKTFKKAFKINKKKKGKKNPFSKKDKE